MTDNNFENHFVLIIRQDDPITVSLDECNTLAGIREKYDLPNDLCTVNREAWANESEELGRGVIVTMNENDKDG